jgi:hypothetical protein
MKSYFLFENVQTMCHLGMRLGRGVPKHGTMCQRPSKLPVRRICRTTLRGGGWACSELLKVVTWSDLHVVAPRARVTTYCRNSCCCVGALETDRPCSRKSSPVARRRPRVLLSIHRGFDMATAAI